MSRYYPLTKMQAKTKKLRQRKAKAQRDRSKWASTHYSRHAPKGLLPPVLLAAQLTDIKSEADRLSAEWLEAYRTKKFVFKGVWRKGDPNEQVLSWMRERMVYINNDHPSGLSGEHDVVLDAIQAECLGGEP